MVKTMLADLHIHTQCSDGSFTPTEAVRAAKETGIGLVAVCDHNTVAAWPEFSAACAAEGLHCVSGVEIDCNCAGRNLHLLAMHINTTDKHLLDLLCGCRENLDAMSDDLIAAMQADGASVSVEEYNNFTRNAAHGGWKGVDYLGTKGFPTQYPACMAAYKKYKIEPRAPWPDLAFVCEVVHAAGGKAIIAHPGDRLPNEAAQFLSELEILLANGIDGCECYYPSHSAAITQACLSFCERNNLCITCGSDSHGTFAREIHGVIYDLGKACRDVRELRLDGIFSETISDAIGG